MKAYLGLVLVWAVLMLGGLTAKAQDGNGEFHLKKRNGYDLNVSLKVTNGRVQQISYGEWTPINRSGHECGMDASRDDGSSTWTEKGSTTRVATDDETSIISITTRADGLLVQSRCSDSRILFVKQGGKYIGRIVRQ